jgi:hypothetical protein
MGLHTHLYKLPMCLSLTRRRRFGKWTSYIRCLFAAMKSFGRVEVELLSFLSLLLNVDEGSASDPCLYTTRNGSKNSVGVV